MLYELFHLGAENCVTGSCHLLRIQDTDILIDCGITQGWDNALSMDQWPVPPSQIDFFVLNPWHS